MSTFPRGVYLAYAAIVALIGLQEFLPEAGVPPPAPPQGGRGGGGGGFGGGGGGGSSADLVGRTANLKGAIAGIWEMPSDALVKQYNDVKIALPKAIADANAFLVKAMPVSQALKKYDLALTVPSPVK